MKAVPITRFLHRPIALPANARLRRIFFIANIQLCTAAAIRLFTHDRTPLSIRFRRLRMVASVSCHASNDLAIVLCCILPSARATTPRFRSTPCSQPTQKRNTAEVVRYIHRRRPLRPTYRRFFTPCSQPTQQRNAADVIRYTHRRIVWSTTYRCRRLSRTA